MLMRMPCAFSADVNASLVNWLPWSVLKISGWPYRSNASSSASRQNAVSMLIDIRCERIFRRGGPVCLDKLAALLRWIPVAECHAASA
jgi:hypothetical protein